MSLGSKWKKILGSKGLTEFERTEFEREKRRRKVLNDLPASIRAAMSEGEEYAKVYGWVTPRDLPDGDVGKFYRLMNGRPLDVSEVRGIARDVVEWCCANGLNVFIESETIALNEDEYVLVARPR